MTLGDRRAAIAAALGGGDDDVVIGAVLNAPPMLSSLSDAQEHDLLRARWRQLRHPAELDRIQRLSRAVDDATNGGHLAMSFASGLSDSAIVHRAEKSARAVEQAMNT